MITITLTDIPQDAYYKLLEVTHNIRKFNDNETIEELLTRELSSDLEGLAECLGWDNY